MPEGYWELVAPQRWRWVSGVTKIPSMRSALPMPHVISDTMPPVEQVDGRFYTSKAKFRAVGRAHGLTEIGTEKLKPKRRTTSTKAQRMASLQKAVAEYKMGRRAKRSGV